MHIFNDSNVLMPSPNARTSLTYIWLFIIIRRFVISKAYEINWRERDIMRKFIKTFPGDVAIPIYEFVTIFFKISEVRMVRHFEQWRAYYLPLCLEDDPRPAAHNTNCMLGKEEDRFSHLPTSYYLTKHKTKIYYQVHQITDK